MRSKQDKVFVNYKCNTFIFKLKGFLKKNVLKNCKSVKSIYISEDDLIKDRKL